MTTLREERVLGVRYWTDTLFSFATTRDPAFRFESGQFTRIGLPEGERPLLRAYSMASSRYADHLEFFSIKVPDGPLTSRLGHLKVGDPILVGRKVTGTLVLHSLRPGERLYLLGTGTGLAPFASLIRDPETYERFGRVVLVHGCRRIADLAYGEEVVRELMADEDLGGIAAAGLLYHPTVTREPFRNRGRVTDLIASARLTDELGQAPLDPARDRLMICGAPEMVREARLLLTRRGFVEGSAHEPGDFVVERAFVERD